MIACKDYTIHINDWSAVRSFIADGGYQKILVVVDQNTKRLCLPVLKQELQTDELYIVETAAGEEHKDLHSCTHIWEDMLRYGADRHSLCINLGGGVVGDMGGFSAATFMRGMDFIQVPTTLLSQVDASVGGKLGVDFQGYKNMIGLIQAPSAVFIFTEFLETLPYRELLSGFAELLKHGLIADEAAYGQLSALVSLEDVSWAPIVEASVRIKQAITEEDPREQGIRKILNYGHTLGHAIESIRLTTPHPLLHGEAIAIGMVLEAYLSYELGYIAAADCNSVRSSMLKFYKKQELPTAAELLPLMLKDKKNKDGVIRFSLLQAIGRGNYDQEVNTAHIAAALRYYDTGDIAPKASK